MRPLEYTLVVLSVVIAAVCVKLGFWQIRRLHERQAYNAIVASRLGEAPVTMDQLPRDTATQHYRRVTVAGIYDYTHQIVLTSRSYQGSPGINLITPVRVPGTDTAVLVNRGWIYAADGTTANETLWREADSVHAVGYVTPFSTQGVGNARLPSHPKAYRWLGTTIARDIFPYPVHPFLVVLQGDVKVQGGTLPRVDAPPLDEGPHRSYAIQWFAFAIIAIVGITFFIRRGTSRDETLGDDGTLSR